MRASSVSVIWLLLGAVSIGAPAFAAGNESGGKGDQQAQETSENPPAPPSPPSIASSLGGRGDTRSALERAGITYSFTYIGEGLGAVTGGLRKGTIYEGNLQGVLDADLDKLLGWSGASLHATFYQIHGRGLSRFYIGNLMPVSGIEALPSTRLYELWLEQKFAGDKVALRAGQLGADTEFLVSQYGTLFLNATFGWPAIAMIDLPSGGPSYPLATPGVRFKITPTDNLTILAAVFDGNPAGPGPGDPQRRNHTGLAFRTSDPAFLIGEIQYAYNQGKDAPGLPGTIKFGGWHHFGSFADQRYDIGGLPLADPRSSGLPNQLRGNDGLYAVIDQMVYRTSGTDQGIGAFARISASPSDRNLISFYADGGLTWKGMIPGREDDTFGLSFAYSRISNGARGFDQDINFFTDSARSVRTSEAVIEVTYQAQIVPGWTIQPDFQYVFRPGGNASNPRDPTGARIKDAAIFGLRTTIRY
ncbi:carbohydrate porin [Microvirga alba]|uniref:Carbohydrate porin n=1 Tax=Microvirga alba TaxID=2791025 RepID=A0A931BMT6_9HYPH|nr:carbohydrate porin [Microvirga alba]MBF9232200.1 carbohydrate porin [Microvirga alba]